MDEKSRQEAEERARRWASPTGGMNSTTAILGLGVVFVMLALLMIARSGHDDATSPKAPPVASQEKTN